MRILLLIAVIALVVDAAYYDGAHTQSTFRYLTVATEQLSARLGVTEHPGSDGEPPADTTRL